jgi:hypothetical protein
MIPFYLKCVASPSEELALTNCIYVNPVDARTPYVNLGNFIFRCQPLASIAPGSVALNAIQRLQARTFEGAHVEMWEFLIPVARDFSIASVKIEACGTHRPADLSSLANNIRTNLTDHVLYFGQSISMRYEENDILLWVKSNVRGLVTGRTDLMVEWRESVM